MHYLWQFFFYNLFTPALFGNDNLAYGGRILTRTNDELRDGQAAFGLAEYVSVAPLLADNVRRQASGATAVAVPKNQLEGVLLQAQQMQLAVLILINQYLHDGTLDSEDPSGVFAGENVISISSPSVASIAPGPFASTGNLIPLAPTNTYTGLSASVNDPSAAASSTTSTSAVASTTLLLVDAGSTTIADSGGANLGTLSAAASTNTRGLAAPTTQKTTLTYTFNAQSSKNVAVYFGQTAVTGGTTLAAQCADPNIDIVVLAFVIAASYQGSPYPQVNFGAACGGQTAAMKAKAPGLLSCTQLATDIGTCQSMYGKKVLLSLGGADSQITFPTTTSASTFATTLWNLFGPPGNIDINLRPFGTAQLDGFDIDNENQITTNWLTLASTLRTLYSTYKTKTYYLSSAPQCPFPDLSNPLPLLLLCDFVWVQFYNNPSCQIGSPDFLTSVRQWSAALSASKLPVKTRFFVGAPAFSAAGQSAYASFASAQGIQSVVQSVRGLGLANLGGAMFWDGPEGRLNLSGGKNIFAWAKAGLTA